MMNDVRLGVGTRDFDGYSELSISSLTTISQANSSLIVFSAMKSSSCRRITSISSDTCIMVMIFVSLVVFVIQCVITFLKVSRI